VKILVIDDDRTQVELLAAILRANGHKVETASSAAAALLSTHRDPPDAVIVDLYLTGPDGLDLCERMRTMGAIDDTPFVVISASGCEADRKRAADAGAFDYLVKPLTEDALLAVVANLAKHIAA
jgi:DNA-binding response OmpR family regulator